MDNAKLAREILAAMGGKDNIIFVSNCVTRIRVNVWDEGKVDREALRAAGISGALQVGETVIDIIIGPRAQAVCDEIKKLLEGGGEG